MSVIFPNLPSELDLRILSFCTVASLVRLGGSHTKAYQVLSNAPFFKELFERKHPHLKPYDKLFSELRSCHLSNCYKVICVHMSSPPLWTQKWSSAFLEKGCSEVVLSMRSRKEQLENNILELYGPDSPIEVAESISKRCEEELQALYGKYQRARSEKSKTQLLEIINNKEDELERWQDDYNEVISQRKAYVRELQQINGRLRPERLDELSRTHSWTVLKELITARELHDAFVELPKLQQCSICIKELLEHFDKTTPLNFNPLIQMIDALAGSPLVFLKMIGTSESENRLNLLRERHRLEVRDFGMKGLPPVHLMQLTDQHRREIDEHYEREYPLKKTETFKPENLKDYLVKLQTEVSRWESILSHRIKAALSQKTANPV